MKNTLYAAFLASSLLAADSAVEGPSIGYINSAAGVRRVLGSVGASRLSQPVTGELKGAAVLPGKDAVVVTHPEGGLVKINLNDGSVSSMGVDNVSTFEASPSGMNVAALKDGRVHVISSEGEAKAEYAVSGKVLKLAVADGPASVAITVAEDAGEALYLLSEGSSSRVLHAEGIVGVAFAPESNSVFIATNDGSVYLLKGDLQLSQIGTIPGAVAIAAVSRERALVLAGKTSTLIEASGARISSVECACQPAIAQPLGASRFQISSGNDGPAWLVDASTSELRVAFVPEAVNE